MRAIEMDKWLILILILILICFPAIQAEGDPVLLARSKAFLARRYFLKTAALRPLTIHWHQKWNSTGEGEVKNGALIQNLDSHYIYSDRSIAKLEAYNSSYTLTPLHETPQKKRSYLSQKIEQGTTTYLAACFEGLYCDILTTTADMNLKKLQSISVSKNPEKLHFFLHDDDELFLAIVSDYTTIYRWTETYFNEYQVLLTPGAQDVDTFYSKASTVMIFAQNSVAKDENQLSKVFVKSNGNFELRQLLEVENPTTVKCYTVPTRDDGDQHYIMFLSRLSENQLFWWNLKDLSSWGEVPQVEKQKSIFANYIKNVPFVFIIGEGYISVYEATLQGLTMVKSVSTEGQVTQMGVQNDLLVILSESIGLQPIYVVTVVEMTLNRSGSESHHRYTLKECLELVDDSLRERQNFLDIAKHKIKALGKKEPQITGEMKVLGMTVFNDLKTKKLTINPEGKILTTTPTMLRKRLQKYKHQYEKLKEKSRIANINRNQYLVKGDVSVNTLEADSLNVDQLNQKDVEMDKFLSLSKDQTLEGDLHVQQLKIDDLEVVEINDHSPEDLLLKNIDVQSIKGEKTFHSLYASNIDFSEYASVNGVLFSKYATAHTGNPVKIKGMKTVSDIVAQDFNITSINEDSFGNWYQKMQPDWSVFKDSPAFYPNLTVGSLHVENVNEVPWAEILKHIQSVNAGPVSQKIIKSLTATKINGIPFESFLTKTTPQNVSSDIFASALDTSTNKLVFNSLNKFTKLQVANLIRSMLSGEISNDNPPQNPPAPAPPPPPLPPAPPANETNLVVEQDAANTTALNETVKARKNEFKEILKAKHISRNCPRKLHKGKKNIVVYSNLYVDGPINVVKLDHVDVNGILSKMVLTTDKNASDNIIFTDLEVDFINAKKINNVYMEGNQSGKTLTVNGSFFAPYLKWNNYKELAELRVKGPQTYENVTISGVIKSYIKGMNFVPFASTRLSKTKNQNINCYYDAEVMYVANLYAKLINGLGMENLIFAKGDITINSDVMFKNIGVKGNIFFNPWVNCTLERIADMDVSKEKYFDTVEVLKNLTWNDDLLNKKSLSYIMKNAVFMSRENRIEAKVVFAGNVTMNIFEAMEDVNNVNLNAVAGDAIFSSKRKQKMKTELYVKSPLTVGNAEFKGNVVVDTVDGVSVVKFNDNLFRLEDDIVITGLKTFEKGFKAHNLISGLIHNVKTKNFVTVTDLLEHSSNRTIPNISFGKIHVLHNMTVKYINGVNVSKLLNSRVSLSKQQAIQQDLNIQGNAEILDTIKAGTINDLALSETFTIYDEVISIEGPLVIDNLEFYVNGNFDVGFVNGVNLTNSYKTTIFIDENATLLGDVVFEKGIKVKGNSDIDTINDCRIEKTYDKVKTFVPTYASNAHEFISRINEISNKLRSDAMLQYFEHNSSLNVNIINVKETSVLQNHGNTTEVHIYGMTDEKCGLPENCLCPRHLIFSVSGSDGSQNVALVPDNVRNFHYRSSSLKVTVDVETSTISYSNRCHLSNGQVEQTTLRWKKTDTAESGEVTLADGYLSDVKFFKLGDSVYTILAFYYNGNISESRNLNVTVYELRLSKGLFEKIDSIPAKGAVSVDLIWARTGYFLMIGNTKSEDPASDTVYTEVYRFDERNNKFQGLRKIGTHGVLDLKAVRINKEAFIFIVQKKPWPLLAFKYSAELDNFLFFEKFHSRHGFLSVATIRNSAGNEGNVHIGIVLANNEFRVLEYKYIEGSVEMLSVKQEGIVALQSFSVGATEYLLAISPSPVPSRVLRVVNAP